MTAIQADLFNKYKLDDVINVASIPQRSPFRYPGGKTWLIPHIRRWINGQKNKPKLLIEPFAGGAIVGLTAAAESLVDHVILVELDNEVAAVWKTIIYGDAEWLANKIATFPFSPETVKQELLMPDTTLEEQAFKTILKNRISHGGILAPGAGLIKNGEHGKGIYSRWYPETLKKRILNIMKYREKITFLHDDGISVLKEHSSELEAIYFIDPPYTASGKKAGSRLYTHCNLDHYELFRICQSVKGDLLITYENSEGMLKIARDYGFNYKEVAMSNTHHAKMNELLIGRDLKWAE